MKKNNSQLKSFIIFTLILTICFLCTVFGIHHRNPENLYTSKAIHFIKDKAGWDINRVFVYVNQYIPEKWQYRSSAPLPSKEIIYDTSDYTGVRTNAPSPSSSGSKVTDIQTSKTRPRKIYIAKKRRMYKWTDENGIKHYTDSPPKDPGLIEDSWEQTESRPEPVRRTIARGNTDRNYGHTSVPVRASPPKNIKSVSGSYSKQVKKKTGFREISRGLYEYNGYRFDVSAFSSSNTLKVRGRVSEGEYCENLKVDITCKSKDGDTEYITVNLNNIGGNRSDVIRKDEKIYSYYHKNRPVSERWDITDISAGCTAN